MYILLSWGKNHLVDVKLMVLRLHLLVHSKHRGWQRAMISARHQKWLV